MVERATETVAQAPALAVAPTWERLRDRNLMMIDRLSLIDESANFAVQPFIVKDHLRYNTHYFGEVEFVLLKFFCEPRSRGDVEAYYAGPLRDDLSDPGLINRDLAEYMESILSAGVLTDAGMKHDLIRESTTGGDAGAIVFTAPPMQHHDKVVQSFPITLGINLTERCNLACLHCSVGSNPSVSTKNDLTAAELHDLFDQFDRYGLQSLRLTGGEPMMRPDFWEILEDATTGRRFSVTLFTNGTRVTEENVERLAAIKKRMGSRFLIHISLDGGTAQSHDFLRNRKGNFDRVCRAMKLLREHGVHFYIESVLHERSATVEQIDSMCELVSSYGVTYVSLHPGEMIGTGEHEQTIFFTRDFLVRFADELAPVIAKWAERGVEVSFDSYTFPLSEPTNEDRRARELEQLGRGGIAASGNAIDQGQEDWTSTFKSRIADNRKSGFNVCTAAISQAALGADGTVYGCPRYVGARRYAMGNVRQRDMLAIWTSPGWDFLREDYQPKLKLCNSCDYFDNCFYGKTCRANPGYLFNDAYGVSPECIVEYKKLGLPYEKVKAYLDERKRENLDVQRIQLLCDRLLAQIERIEFESPEPRHAASVEGVMEGK
ncbi:MAG: radical SAM protein [Planctomycetaceae bacterium]|nr:radical SAM protein [Planctomycetaceae bacterium]